MVGEYIDGNFSLTTAQKENMIDNVHTNIHNTTLYTAKLFVGVSGNDVTVNTKGGATCNNKNYLKVLHLS